MKFLCSRHTQAIQSNPVKAGLYWQKLIDSGEHNLKQGNYYKAHQCLGGASEVASLMLKSQVLRWNKYSCIDMLVIACRKLQQTLSLLGYPTEATALEEELILQLENLSTNHQINVGLRTDAKTAIEYSELYEERVLVH
ncbi:hypothetical protein [Marinibactrum halimedae]|uniref:Uncharacterized protein n=1 Tax=Marinibactrum halimedae TaxID=1444977 RepID=A0AA37T8M3_9GAMM|nr:hypothetical protein [Marinibactrum halimedae]MCD9458643.1 hypothetical protein [Marinibactrum halimedae]GLS25991.1 hypothetical protein GCM10007877_17060 [Marinibactrum halimedae]